MLFFLLYTSIKTQMSSLLNSDLGNVRCGSLAQATQSVTGAGGTTQVSPSVGFVLVNATAAGQTLVLPNNAAPGHTVTIIQTAGVNSTVVSEATGTTILGATVSATHDAAGEITSFAFVSAALGWAIIRSSATLA